MSTPDTLNYMIAGYAVIFIILAGYVASLWLRFRKRRREIALLEEALD
jgi:cytochrome bd-type quinol oxidase subunit 2